MVRLSRQRSSHLSVRGPELHVPRGRRRLPVATALAGHAAPQRGIVEAMTDPTGALADRLFRDAAGALELYTIYLGDRLGLYRALHEDGPATSGELAARTGTNERYVREWLEHHAVYAAGVSVTV